MKIFIYLIVLSTIIGLVQPIAVLAIAKTLFDQVFGILMFLGINTGIDSIWATVFPTKDPMDTLREKTMERFEGLTAHIQQAATITVKELNNYIEESQLLLPKMMQIDKLLKKLDSEEKYIEKLRAQEQKFEPVTLRNFADGIISNSHESVISQMAAVHNMVIGTPSSSGHNFIDLFIQSMERTQYHKVCHLKTSPQQAFTELIKLVMKAEMRTLQLGNYAYAIKSMASETFENHTVEAYLLQDVFYNRTTYYADVLQINLPRLSGRFYVCDPPQQSSATFQPWNLDRPFISLMPQVSDIENGRVIVGVKLVIHKDILTFQVMQAPLIGAYFTNATAREWVKVPSILNPEYHQAVTEPYDWKFMAKELTVPENTVLTGIAFVMDSTDEQKIDIQVRYTPILNATTGDLDVEASAWMMETYGAKTTMEFPKKVKQSTSCEVPSFPDLMNGQYLVMKNLGDKKKPNIIPYIDTQEVVPIPMLALSGLGVTHKGHENCGGYLAPVALTLSDYYVRSMGNENDYQLDI